MKMDIRNTLQELSREDLAPAQKLILLRQVRELGPEAAERVDSALLSELGGLRSALRDSSQYLAQLRERVETIMEPPYFPARCLGITETERGVEAYIAFGGQTRMVPVDEQIKGTILAGDEVLLSSNLHRVVGTPRIPLPLYGDTAVLERVIPEGGLLVSVKGESRTVVPTRQVRDQTIQKGDLIQLDPSGIFGLGVVPGSTGDEYLVQSNPAGLASFDDIGGLDAEIKQIKDLILLHARHPEIITRYGLPRENTILLAGRTGSGKTMLAQATCRFVGEIGGNGRSRFMFVGPGDLQDMWYGQTQKHIKALFAAAREAAERDPSPLVIYFEEVDALLRKRTSGEFNRVHNDITAALLAEINNGFQKHDNVWLMASTNRLHDLDSASVRGARFGNNIIIFSSLRRSGAREIFRKHLPASLPFRDGDAAGLIESVVAVLYAPNGDNRIADIQFRDGSKRAVVASDLLSGAEIAKICRMAKERSALREIELGEVGICRNDLVHGVERFLEDSAAKLKPHNCRDYLDLPDDMDVVKVEPARRTKAAHLRVA
jgi:proteasome-associated ATPase